MTNLVASQGAAPVDKTSRWILKEISAVARTATAIARRSQAGEPIPVEERIELQRRKVALLEAINRRSPYEAGAEVALLEAEQELQQLRATRQRDTRGALR
jgi:hypothetical protein